MPPPPRLANNLIAGDDPMFVGGDGVAYEVKGAPGAVFNLLTSATLSINARFEAVPEALRAEDMTDTALGDVAIAICEEGCELQLEHAVDTGLVTRRSRCVASSAVAVTHERLECDLRRMDCAWRPVPAAELNQPVELPLLLLGHSRVTVRTKGAEFGITRSAMVNVDGEIDCARWSAWPAAKIACALLSRGAAPAEHVQLWTLLLRTASAPWPPTPSAAVGGKFYFSELSVTRLDTAATDLHGLLGQRAHAHSTQDGSEGSSPGVNITVSARGQTSSRFGSQGEGAIEGSYRDYETPGLDKHGHSKFSLWRGCS